MDSVISSKGEDTSREVTAVFMSFAERTYKVVKCKVSISKSKKGKTKCLNTAIFIHIQGTFRVIRIEFKD